MVLPSRLAGAGHLVLVALLRPAPVFCVLPALRGCPCGISRAWPGAERRPEAAVPHRHGGLLGPRALAWPGGGRVGAAAWGGI